MNKPLRVLIVEDTEDDALLLLRELRRGGYDLTFDRVDTPEAMKAALQQRPWDVVISDHNMPHFNSTAALNLLQGSRLDLPFIIVSGNIGEEVAVAAMKAGAHDYILKNNLSRLVPAIERELREADNRRLRKQADSDLRESNRQLARALTELRESQQQVVQQERLSALGQMASGVATISTTRWRKFWGSMNCCSLRRKNYRTRRR